MSRTPMIPGYTAKRAICALAMLASVIGAASISHAEGEKKMDMKGMDMRGSHGSMDMGGKKGKKMDMRGSHGSMDMRGSHGSMDMNGMAMNTNSDKLPRSCKKISKNVNITVHAGHKYAQQGQMFSFDKHLWQVPKCARVTVKFINEDQVRHQWMIHGLPRYMYSMGMFHLEANGGTSRTGTFIVPNDNETYLVHCDMAQHMEKGLKGELKVGNGSGDLPSVPTISDARIQADATGGYTVLQNLIILLASVIGFTGIWWVTRQNP